MARPRKVRTDDDLPPSTPPETAEPDNPEDDSPGALHDSRPQALPPEGMPKPPGYNLSPEAFFEYLAAIGQDHWSHVTGYIYRYWPIIKRPHKQKSIDVFSEAITMQYMAERHGSGDYRIYLNNMDIKGSFKCVAKTHIRYRDPAKPPKVILPELQMNDPANKDFVEQLIAEGKLTPEREIAMPDAAGSSELARQLGAVASKLLDQQAKPPAANPESAAITKAMDIIAQAGKQGIEMATTNADPSRMVSLLSAIKELLPQQSGGDTRILELLMKQAADSAAAQARAQERQVELLMKLMDRDKTPATPANPTGQLKEIAETFATMRDLFRGGSEDREDMPAAASGKRPWWQDLISGVAPQLGGMLQPVIAYALQRAMAPQALMQPPTSAPTAPAAELALPPSAQTNPPKQEQQPMAGQFTQYIIAIAQPLMTHLQQGLNGHDFADWFIGGYGQMQWRAVANIGPDQLVSAFRSVPEVWQQIAPIEPQFLAFVAEFCAGPAEDEDSETEQGE